MMMMMMMVMMMMMMMVVCASVWMADHGHGAEHSARESPRRAPVVPEESQRRARVVHGRRPAGTTLAARSAFARS